MNRTNATLVRHASRALGVAALLGLALAATQLSAPVDANAQDETAAAVAVDPERGEKLYALCAQCHGENGAGNPMALAPSIAGLPQWFVEGQLKKFKNGARGTHFDDIPGMRMRPMSLWLKQDSDVVAVAEFVANMEKAEPVAILEGGDPEAGKAKYLPCTACHGQNGQGNQALNAPPLAGMSDWYQLWALKAFKAGIRGTNPLDTTGALMRPMSMTLADEQQMLDVIAYIGTLSGE
ncbi:MAG: c-type cytochrome [Myxococcota bacterium]